MYFCWVLGWPYYICAEVVPTYLVYMGETSLWSFLLHTSFGWEGGSSSLFDGSGWKRGAVAQGVAHFMSLSILANDGPESCVGQLMNQGSFGGRSGVVRLYFQYLFSLSLLQFPLQNRGDWHPKNPPFWRALLHLYFATKSKAMRW